MTQEDSDLEDLPTRRSGDPVFALTRKEGTGTGAGVGRGLEYGLVVRGRRGIPGPTFREPRLSPIPRLKSDRGLLYRLPLPNYLGPSWSFLRS